MTLVKAHLHYREFLARLGQIWYAYQKNWFGSDKFYGVNDFAVPNFIRAEPKYSQNKNRHMSLLDNL